MLADDTAGTIRRLRAAACARAAPQSLHQDSGHPRRSSRDRGVDLRRRAGECHAAVLARAVHRGGRSLHARDRATDRRRPRPEGRFRGIAVRQPLGRGGQGQGSSRRSATVWGSPSPSARTRPTAICWRRRAGGNSPLPARGRSACSGPAPAPRIPPPRIRSTSKRWRPRTPSTPSREDPARLRRAWQSERRVAGRWRRCRGGDRRIRPRRGGRDDARRPAPARGRRILRHVMAGSAGCIATTSAKLAQGGHAGAGRA